MFIGIDWGTNSSKWAIWRSESRSRYLVGRIQASIIGVHLDELRFGGTKDARVVVLNVKQEILHNPIAYPFWTSEREDSGTTLGELVAFSLSALINDALSEAKDRDLRSTKLDIGFSMPNWISDGSSKHIRAAQNFCEAAAVAVACSTSQGPKAQPQQRFAKKEIRNSVQNAVKALGGAAGLRKYAPDWATMTRTAPPTFQYKDAKWRFIVESCAAGLPYLRTRGKDFRFRKILVVDVGAGSTDVGYLLKTETREGDEKLNYFPPAGTLAVAGNDLTDRLVRLYKSRGQQLTQDQAEVRKLNPSFVDEWASAVTVREWARTIAAHAAEYLVGVRDQKWLYEMPPLEIALTGGSGVVPQLGATLSELVGAALRERSVPARIREATKLMETRLAGTQFRDDAEYGRRAVSLGASDSDIPGFREIEAITRDPGLPTIERFPTQGI